jgi:hypothetical protein
MKNEFIKGLKMGLEFIGFIIPVVVIGAILIIISRLISW